MYDQTLLEQTLTDTISSFDLSNYEGTDNQYLVGISHNNSTEMMQTMILIKLVDGREADNIRKKEQALLQQLSPDRAPALTAVLMATFYDDSNLFADADYHYKKAIQLQPEVKEYQALYTDFLSRNIYYVIRGGNHMNVKGSVER